MVLHSTKILNLVNSNPSIYVLRQRMTVMHFILIAQSKRISTPFTQTVGPFEKFSANFYLYPAPITAVLVYPHFFVVILKFFSVFVYHSKQILEGVVGCVWVYRQEVELRWRWEYGDEKTRIN